MDELESLLLTYQLTYLIASIVFLIVDVAVAVHLGKWAASKGYSRKMCTLVPLLLGVPGWIFVAVLVGMNRGTHDQEPPNAVTYVKTQNQYNIQINSLRPEDKKRLNYWIKHKEEHRALLQRKIEVGQKLKSPYLSAAERNELKRTLQEIDFEIYRERP